MCKYGEKDNERNSNRLLQDKVHINFIYSHLIGNLNGSARGKQFDEMQSGKVGRGSDDLQVCMPVNVSIKWKDTKIQRNFQSLNKKIEKDTPSTST